MLARPRAVTAAPAPLISIRSNTDCRRKSTGSGMLLTVTPAAETDDLLDATEVAELLGLAQRTSVSVYRSRYPDFPQPVIQKSRCLLWRRSDVLAWTEEHRKQN